MSEYLGILSPAISDDADLTAGSEVSAMPVKNLQTDQPTEVWRTSGLSNTYVVIDMGQAVAVNMVSLRFTNLSSSAQYKIRAATSEASLTASPDEDTGFLDFWSGATPSAYDRPGIDHFIDGGWTYRYWRIDLSDGSNADGYLEAGRLLMDTMIQPTSVNVQLDSLVLPTPMDREQRTELGGGAVYARRIAAPRRAEFSFRLTAAEFESDWFLLLSDRRSSGPVVVYIEPDASEPTRHQRSIYGLITDLEAFTLTNHTSGRLRFAMREML